MALAQDLPRLWVPRQLDPADDTYVVGGEAYWAAVCDLLETLPPAP